MADKVDKMVQTKDGIFPEFHPAAQATLGKSGKKPEKAPESK